MLTKVFTCHKLICMYKVCTLLTLAAILSATYPPSAEADDRLKIAIVDTGYQKPRGMKSVNLCKGEHKDFSDDKRVFQDHIGHGTNIAHIIDGFLRKRVSTDKYCLVIVKFYGAEASSDGAVHSEKALKYSGKINADIINFSGGGEERSDSEAKVVSSLLDRGLILVMAAGNNGHNLDKGKTYYPAMADDRVIVVGLKQKDGSIHPLSNRGKVVDRYEVAIDVRAGGKTMTGTSQATAIATAKIAYEEILRRMTQDDRTFQH